jgi:H+/Cl- antiporter ClcA
MRKKILEESILFISIAKWLFLASCIGILVGFSTTIFLKILNFSISFTGNFQYYYFSMPIAFFVISIFVKYLSPDAGGHGTDKIIEAVHKDSGKINIRVVPIKLIATVASIAAGGSAGKEGPAAQIGAALSSGFAQILGFNDKDRKKLVICGISAGFATIFGTPIAGALFGVEVLFIGSMMYDVLLPSFVAGIVGYQISSSLGVTYFYGTINIIPAFSSLFFLKICVSGIFFGICAFALIETHHFFQWLSNTIKIWSPLKGLIGGTTLILLTLIFSTRYLGLGLGTIEGVLNGDIVPHGAFLLKILFTAITLNFGGNGGIITPIFFIGATAGCAFGNIFGLDTQFFAAIGMVSLLAGATNTPISASVMAIELFGPEIAPYAAVACVISYLMTGHRSVEPCQIVSCAKSSSLKVINGSEVKSVKDIEYIPRARSLIGVLKKLIGMFVK